MDPINKIQKAIKAFQSRLNQEHYDACFMPERADQLAKWFWQLKDMSKQLEEMRGWNT